MFGIVLGYDICCLVVRVRNTLKYGTILIYLYLVEGCLCCMIMYA
jgi:hypothetical protein